MTPENFKFKHRHHQRGFTLIETLVSLVILTVALIPILNLSSSASRVSSEIQDNLVASGLAQEGVEVIHALRDTNWFNNLAFDSGLGNGNYRVEWNSTSMLSLGSSPALNLNNGHYTYSGGTPTKFSRTISITKIDAGELKIVSQVTWLGRSNEAKSITAEDHLFNWR